MCYGFHNLEVCFLGGKYNKDYSMWVDIGAPLFAKTNHMGLRGIFRL